MTTDPPPTSTTTTLPPAVTTTTTSECPNTGTTDPRATTAGQVAALLTNVAVTNVACRDSVTFTFRKNGVAAPSCTVEYQPGPFTQDGSGAPVAVGGTAFVVVRCEPAYGYDFENAGTPTYTGSKRIAGSGTKHVREVVSTGDFEGVISWVIGLDGQRAFGIASGGTPERRLIVTFE